MSKCTHNKLRMGYVEASLYADKQMRKGVKQTYCPKCKLWLWPCEVKGPKKPRVVRVKAWCNYDKDGGLFVADNINGQKGHDFPCTIIIEAKYLKEKK